LPHIWGKYFLKCSESLWYCLSKHSEASLIFNNTPILCNFIIYINYFGKYNALLVYGRQLNAILDFTPLGQKEKDASLIFSNDYDVVWSNGVRFHLLFVLYFNTLTQLCFVLAKIMTFAYWTPSWTPSWILDLWDGKENAPLSFFVEAYDVVVRNQSGISLASTIFWYFWWPYYAVL